MILAIYVKNVDGAHQETLIFWLIEFVSLIICGIVRVAMHGFHVMGRTLASVVCVSCLCYCSAIKSTVLLNSLPCFSSSSFVHSVKRLCEGPSLSKFCFLLWYCAKYYDSSVSASQSDSDSGIENCTFFKLL
jgi:hypothetical protein